MAPIAAAAAATPRDESELLANCGERSKKACQRHNKDPQHVPIAETTRGSDDCAELDGAAGAGGSDKSSDLASSNESSSLVPTMKSSSLVLTVSKNKSSN